MNKETKAGVPLISEKNYQTIVGDLLGVRIICLRLSDVEKVEAYLKFLSEENILNFVRGPDYKNPLFCRLTLVNQSRILQICDIPATLLFITK